MQYRYMGKTGLKVSELCLGAMTFGRETSEADSFAILDRFAAAGGNFIDTADVYSEGRSEEITGQALKNLKIPRENVVVATKVFGETGTAGVNSRGSSRIGSPRPIHTPFEPLFTAGPA